MHKNTAAQDMWPSFYDSGGSTAVTMTPPVKSLTLYVLTVPGSAKHRLPAVDPHEFTNLYLAGDWTDNGLLIRT